VSLLLTRIIYYTYYIFAILYDFVTATKMNSWYFNEFSSYWSQSNFQWLRK